MKFPAFLPTQDDYERDQFYIRECYPRHYELIMDEFDHGMKRVVVTRWNFIVICR